MSGEAKASGSGKRAATDTDKFMSPSEYSKKISLCPENILRKKASQNKKQPTEFTSNPKVIVFQKFILGNVYSVTLQIQNTSEVPHQVRLVQSNDVVFNVVFKGTTLNTRLAPGMSHVYEVEFTPDEERDYFYEITFKTDVGNFVVPVTAIGPRALLSFPDQIDMEQTALKVTKTKPILMVNTGDKTTGFSIFTDNPNFTVAPAKGTARIGDAIQLVVNFTPLSPGIAIGHIFLRYDPGDTVQSTIYGEGVKCDVRVRKEEVKLEGTYLGLSRLATIEVNNPSDYLLGFKWMNYKSVDEDLEEKIKCEKLIEPDKIMIASDEISKCAQELIRQRIYADSVELLKNKHFVYSNTHFDIFPTDGSIWPCKSIQVSVNFAPKEVGYITSTAYLDVGGLEQRIPISLSGKCLGPALELNILSLDIQEVYLCSTYCYEVVCKNAGPIPGTLVHMQKTADFGSTIIIEPSEISVNIGELKSMKLAFRSNRTGSFIERVDFSIKESSEILSLVIKGVVICPLIRTNSENLDFALTSLGFTAKKVLNLHNLSHEPIEFSITVPSDGYETCITHQEIAKSQMLLELPEEPREFYICPSDGVIKPESPVSVQIFFTPNLSRTEDIELRIDLCKSSNAEPLILPMRISANSAIFEITPGELKIRFCFINHPYCRSLVISNVTDIDGYFYISPQEIFEDTTVLYSLSSYQGCVKPQQSKEITLTLIVKATGTHKFSLDIYSLGLTRPVAYSEVICTAQGPALTADPSSLNWGETKLLQKTSLTLKLSNDSPIGAEFTTSLSKTKGIWEVEPTSGELEPNETISLNVSVFLRDSDAYSDTLIISIPNGKAINVPLAAVGTGTSIVFCPDIMPTFDMGIQFRRENISIPIMIKNEGTKHHHIVFTNGQKEEKNRPKSKSSDKTNNNIKFQIEPNSLELSPGGKSTLNCKICWNSVETVTEQWLMNATINGQGKNELLGTITLTATFVEPNVVFDKRELTFKLDLGHDCDFIQQRDQLCITNQSSRSVTAHLTIDKPFNLIGECNCPTDWLDTSLTDEDSIIVRVYFPFNVAVSDTIQQIYEGYLRIEYDEIKSIDKILCKAEVNFPHVNLIPHEINMYSAYEWNTEEEIKMENDSPLTVFFKIKWLRHTFTYQSLALLSRSESEGGQLTDQSTDLQLCPSISDYSMPEKACTCKINECCKPVEDKESLEYEEGWSESSSELKSELCTDLVDRFLQISPAEGQIPPNTTSSLIVKFNGFERAKISIQAIVEVARGVSQLIYINATADAVRCEIRDRSLDFGVQLFSKPSVTMLRVINHCRIPLKWDIEKSSDLMRILESPKELEPISETVIPIERLPSAPGLFREKIFFEVMRLDPFVIDVMWLATIPQIYLEVSRDDEIKKYPPEFGYRAIQLLSSEWIVSQEVNSNIPCSASDIVISDHDEFTDYDWMQLADDQWHVVARDDRYPNQTDVDMAFERLLFKDHIEKKTTKSFFASYTSINQKISLPLVPAYVINLDRATVGKTEQLSIPLRNYGFEKIKCTLRREGTLLYKFPESCFDIRLDKNKELCQCESDTLSITLKTNSDMVKDMRTDITCRFFIDVKRGPTIPGIIRVSLFYSDVSLSTYELNFDKVYVGTCKEMSFVLENNEYVASEWEMWFNALKFPAFLLANRGIYQPREKAVVKVYFQPIAQIKSTVELIIQLIHGRECKRIKLIGCGVERNVTIDKTKFRFPPIVPNSDPVYDYFTVENKNSYELELYWQHKNDFSELNRCIRIFKHYRKKVLALVPGYKIDDRLRGILLRFYHNLIEELKDRPDMMELVESLPTKIGDNNGSDVSQALTSSQVDSDDWESILHAYIDKLQEEPNFVGTMKNPLSVFSQDEDVEKWIESSEIRSIHSKSADADSSKKSIIVFHGAPYTEYQETACRSAKSLGLPLLNLNQAILEGIDEGAPQASLKLADLIDRRYRELTSKFEKLTVVASARSTVSLDDQPNKLLQLLRKIPPAEELDRADRYTAYELKFDVISCLAKYFAEQGKDKKTRQQDVLPGVGQDMLRDILRERLAQPEYCNGYVLQSLNNDFVDNETVTIKALLDATGDVSTYLLITFNNSFELYEQRMNKLNGEEDLESKSLIDDNNEILKSMQDYQIRLNALLDAIGAWESGSNAEAKRAKSRKANSKPVLQDNASVLKPTEKFFVWHVRPDDPWDEKMYDATVSSVSELFRAQLATESSSSQNKPPAPALQPKTYFYFREYPTQPDLLNDVFLLTEHVDPPEILPLPDNKASHSENNVDTDNELKESKSVKSVSKKCSRMSSKSAPQLHTPKKENRWIIKPHESRKFKVKFMPKEEGRYEKEFALSFWDDPSVTYKIHVEGIAEIPRLDMLPSSIFDRVKNTRADESHDPTYFLDLQSFDFGNLFVLPKSNSSHKKLERFKFKNISAVLVSATFTLSGENFDCFEISPEKIEIEPDDVGVVTVTATAHKIGHMTAELNVSIERNEQVETIQLECNGIELDVEVEPKCINLKRVLLNCTESQIITVKNKAAIPVCWRLSADDTDAQIRLTLTQGKTKGRGECKIELQYYANKITAEDKKFINFDVFLKEKDPESIKSDVISVTAEVYEILVSIEDSNLIDLGSVPVHSASEKSFVIRNLGSYEVQYEIQYNDLDVLKSMIGSSELTVLVQDIKISSMSGLILPKKQALINVIFTPSVEVSLKSVPFIKCLIIEPFKEVGLVKDFLLNVTAVSYYTRFFVEPSPNVNFGSLALKSTKTMLLNITNTGKFLLKYNFINQPISELTERNSVISKRDKKARQLSKQRLSTAKRPGTLSNAPLKLGPFKLEKAQGELSPGQTDTLTINCYSEIIGHFDEKMSILVSDSLPFDDENQTISLLADICSADFDFNNYYEIFTESHIVNSFEEFHCTKELGDHTVFSKVAMCLYFRRVYVGSRHSTSVTLRNISAVEGDIVLELTENNSSSFSDVFSISSSRLQIAPISKQSFTVTFAPQTLGIVRGELIARVDLPQSYKQKIFKIYLEGEGCVPQIRICEPIGKDDETTLMDFGKTFVAVANEKTCKIENIGRVTANLAIQFSNNPEAVFGVDVVDEENTLMDHWNESSDLSFKIYPESATSVVLRFLPKKIGKREGSFRILIEHNPYDVVDLQLTGEGFEKPVILENLTLSEPPIASNSNENKEMRKQDSCQRSRKTLKSDTSLTKIDAKPQDSSPLFYTLDYGQCFLNQINKITFRIVNKTRNSYYRFEWDSLSNLVCTPTVGHLGPNNFKELTATFLDSEPAQLVQVPVACKIQEITFDEPILEPLWDSRQTQVSWIEKDPSYSSEMENVEENEDETFIKKIVDKIDEPSYNVVPDSVQSLQLLVFAVANYSEYQCDVSVINFEDTLMFQTKECKFTLSNPGTVNLNFSWVLLMDEEYPRRLDQISWESMSTFETRISGELLNKKTQALNKVLTCLLKKKLKFGCDASESNKKSDLFSSSAGLTDRSTDSWIEGENWPFEILPESGSIDPGKNIECTLKFIPVDVFEYKAHLQCKIENLEPQSKSLDIAITARSLLPYCHFEIEDSDYLSASRRDNKLPVPSQCSLADFETRNKIRVVEFKVVGVGECQLKNIFFVNPTCEDYYYQWTNLTHALSDKLFVFQCLGETGTAEKGKRTKTTFSFVPEEIGLFEFFWKFEIKKYDLTTLFLIVVNVVEPSVYCRNSIIELEACTIDQLATTSFEIVNNESYPLVFEITNEATYAEARHQTISISPLTGQLNPNSSQIISVEFVTSRIGEYTFNIECKIEKLRKPIKIFILARVFPCLAEVTYNLENEEKQLHENFDNVIDFKELLLNMPITVEFKITNTGQIGLDYAWALSTSNQDAFEISVAESQGQIEPNHHDTCHLQLMATKKVTIRNYHLGIKIKNGPTYRMKLNALAKSPPLEFNFSEYDFGLCYVQTQNGHPYSVELAITNNQRIPVTIECDYHNTRIKLEACPLQRTILPKSQAKVPIYFQPVEETAYQEIFHFLCPEAQVEKKIMVRGEGIPYQIRLKNPCDAMLNIGKIKVGDSATRKIVIVNEGRATVPITVLPLADDVFHLPHDPCAGGREPSSAEELSISRSASQLQSDNCSLPRDLNILEFIEIIPSGLVDLKAGKELKVAVKIKALQRVEAFDLKLGMDVRSTLLPLTVIKGQCVAASLCLSRTYLSFGTIYSSDSVEEKLVLTNNGDVETKFRWNTEKMSRAFKINPLTGYCPVGREVVFTCVCKPLHFGSEQTEAILELQDYKNIVVTMTVNSSPTPSPKGTIEFQAYTSKSDTKSVTIENDTDKTWSLKAKIFGYNSQYFKVDATFEVLPKSSKSCYVTYSPQRVTNKQYPDKGRLVIWLPDGRVPIVYDLTGQCYKSPSVKKIQRRLLAKTKYTETLLIYNNDDSTRKFHCVANELVGEEAQIVSSFEIDVPGNSQVEYKFPFYFEDEGIYYYKIEFNDFENNVQCYEIEFEVTWPIVEKPIELVTYVRSPTFSMLKIENDLPDASVTYSDFSACKEISIHGLPVTLAPLQFKNVRLQYLPLIPGDKQDTLTLISEDSREVRYKLHLIARPVLPERAKSVETRLGQAVDFPLYLRNCSDEPQEYSINVNEPAFICPSTIQVPGNEQARIDVVFEPYALEQVSGIVTATSNAAGEFIFPITGTCLPPQSQGPYVSSVGAPALIAFKNVFLERQTFKISVDKPDFVVKDDTLTVDSKEVATISVELQPRDETSDGQRRMAAKGKVTVSCLDPALSCVKWTHYIKAGRSKNEADATSRASKKRSCRSIPV